MVHVGFVLGWPGLHLLRLCGGRASHSGTRRGVGLGRLALFVVKVAVVLGRRAVFVFADGVVVRGRFPLGILLVAAVLVGILLAC